MSKSKVNWHDDTNAVPIYVKCECYSEGIEIQYYREDDNDKGFYVNYWKYGITGRYTEMSFIDKLKYAWKILIHGTLHGDQIILSMKDSKLLKQYLEKHIDYDENNN